jgi:hypothetical protein
MSNGRMLYKHNLHMFEVRSEPGGSDELFGRSVDTD